MKNIVVILVSFLASTALACPDLNGTYQCEKNPEDAADTGVISFFTDNSDGQTVYILTDIDDDSTAQLPTDGQTYQDGHNSYTGSCSENNFRIKLTGIDETVGPFALNMVYFLDSGTNLKNSGVIKFKYEGQPHQQEFSSTCTRL